MERFVKSRPARLLGVLVMTALPAACGQDDAEDNDEDVVAEQVTEAGRSDISGEGDELQEVELMPDGSLRQIDTPQPDSRLSGENIPTDPGNEGPDPEIVPEPEPIDTEALLAAIRARDAELAVMSVRPEGPPTITTLRALDKITARITELEAVEDQEVRFGTLAITTRTCRSRPPEEPPETFAFLEIDDVNTSEERTRVFSGWMLASSPALNPLEHAVYDVWVVACRTAEASPEGG